MTEQPASRDPDSPEIEFRIARNIAAVDELVDDWKELTSRHALLPSVQFDASRYLVELKTLAPHVTPRVILFRDRLRPRALIVGRLFEKDIFVRLGYASFRISSLRCFAIAHVGIVTDGTPEAASAVMEYLGKERKGSDMQLLVINHLPRRHELFDRLRGLGPDKEDPDVHWIFRLGPTYEESVKGFSSKHRANLRRADRVICEAFAGDVKTRVWNKTEDVARFCDIAGTIVSRTYQAALSVGFSDTPLWRAFLSEEAGLGRMRCYTLECGGQPIAFHVGVVHDGVYMLEETAFLPEYGKFSPGQVLLVRVIKDLCAAGVRSVDHGFGDAYYKRAFGSECIEEATLSFYGVGVRPYFAKAVTGTADVFMRPMKALARRTGLDLWLKRKWRKRAQDRVSVAQRP